MKKSDSPKKQPVVFASSGWKEPILDTTPEGDSTASYKDGFPPVTMTPIADGGIPPKGGNTNQILYELSALARWYSAGMPAQYDADFADKIGGYPKNAIVQGNDGILYVSSIDDNTEPPASDATNWTRLVPVPVLGVYNGEIRLLPFRISELPMGWFPCNGATLTLNSPEGQALNGLSANYKTDWGIVVTDTTISLPNLFKNGVGYFLRPVNGVSRLPGSRQDDAIRNITGMVGLPKWYSETVTTGVFKREGIPSRTGNGTDYDGGAAVFDLNNINYPVADEIRPINIGMTAAIFLGINKEPTPEPDVNISAVVFNPASIDADVNTDKVTVSYTIEPDNANEDVTFIIPEANKNNITIDKIAKTLVISRNNTAPSYTVSVKGTRSGSEVGSLSINFAIPVLIKSVEFNPSGASFNSPYSAPFVTSIYSINPANADEKFIFEIDSDAIDDIVINEEAKTIRAERNDIPPTGSEDEDSWYKYMRALAGNDKREVGKYSIRNALPPKTYRYCYPNGTKEEPFTITTAMKSFDISPVKNETSYNIELWVLNRMWVNNDNNPTYPRLIQLKTSFKEDIKTLTVTVPEDNLVNPDYFGEDNIITTAQIRIHLLNSTVNCDGMTISNIINR